MKYCVVILLSSLLLSMVSARPSQAVASQLAFTKFEEVDWEDPIRTHTVLVVLGESEGYCTGVIISRTVALTAAHCVEGRKPPRVMLINDSGVSHSIPVRRYAAAPERKKGEPAHDIAV